MLFAGIWILIIAFSLTTLRSLGEYFMVDRRKMRIYRKKVEKWQNQREKAEKEQNPRLLKKVKSQKSKIQKFQMEMSKERMKPMCLFIIPFFVVFLLIRYIFPNPFPTGLNPPMNWILQRFFTSSGMIISVYFYVLCNAAANTLVRVLFQMFNLLEKPAGGMGGMGMSPGR